MPTQELPEAELEDSLELQHGWQGPFTAAGLVGPGWLGEKQLPSEPAPQTPTDQGGATMCSETGSRYTGMLLLPLAIAAIIANLLLYFPNGQVLEPAKITDLVWFFHGFLGAGLLVMVPALMLLRGGGGGCCVHRCGMLFPMLLAIQGTMGAVYCVVISSLGLLSGPFCDTGSGNYTYPFRNDSLEGNYLFNQPTWATCQEPEHIVLWNVVLFSILLGIGVVEAVLCLSQVISGLCDVYCGACIGKGQVNITGL